MLSIRKSLPAVAAVLCLLAIGMVGCGGGGSTSLLNGTGQIQVNLVDARLNADEVNVDITSIQVHSEENGWVTVRTFATPLRVNLLDYSTSGTSLLLADAPLAAGHYTMIRLMLSAADVVIAGVPHAVDLTNVTQTGVKCNGEFTVADGQLVALTLDFNAGKSFVQNPPGSGNYKLHPVMSMSPTNIASEVVGSVAFVDADSNPLPLPDTAEINAYPAGQVGVADALVTGSQVQADGTFRISALAQGTYDFEVVAEGASVKQLTGVTVTPPSTNLGVITVTAAP